MTQPAPTPGADPNALRAYFTLDKGVHFLNHGSFGATPKPVQRAAQRARAQMERQPVAYLGRALPGLLAAARAPLAALLGVAAAEIVFVPNATYGVNVVARSLEPRLRAGDEVLATNHEYGACSNAWEAVCARTGARYIRHAVPMPDEPRGDANAIVSDLWAQVTPRTRVLYLSHITSPTALRLPIEPIVMQARAAGIWTVIDGAHAPGQLALDLGALGADFYTGNCHKWLCAPKGSGFLYARADVQPLVQPLVVSWGSGPERQFFSGNDMHDALSWSGTSDYSAYLAVPAAIRFQQRMGRDQVRARAAALLDAWLPRLAAAVDLPPIYPAHSPLRPPQMAVTPLPATTNLDALKARLYDEWRIEIPVTRWRDRCFVRVSAQGYNDDADLAALAHALAALVPACQEHRP